MCKRARIAKRAQRARVWEWVVGRSPSSERMHMSGECLCVNGERRVKCKCELTKWDCGAVKVRKVFAEVEVWYYVLRV